LSAEPVLNAGLAILGMIFSLALVGRRL
jgi:hypothetical protein